MCAHRVIITADRVDVKLVNRLLFTLRDWEFGDDDSWDNCKILRTKDDACREIEQEELDVPPLREFDQTEWQGLSMEDMEQFMLQNLRDRDKGQSLFTVLDDKGVQDETVTIVKRVINPRHGKKEPLYLNKYQKTRVPWIEAHVMWCNLDIANMDFEDFVVDEEEGGGWWEYKPIEPDEHYAEFISKRNAVVKELKKLDLA